MQQRLGEATIKQTSPAKRERALQWIFGTESPESLSFEDCCIVLESRPWVVRLRVQLQFWIKNMRFSAPIPLLVMPIPERIAEEAYSADQETGMWTVRRLWEWPGATLESLYAHPGSPSPEKIRAALDKLEERGLLVSGFDGLYWYCVGHSPLNRYGRPLNVSWASFWQN